MSETPQSILVVEDDMACLRLFSNALIASGYHVDTAVDGKAGWSRLQEVTYDLLITDNIMPNVSGVELIQKVRFARMTLPVILVSGMVPSGTEWLQLEAILPKPFSLDQLVQTVIEVLNAHPTESA